MTDSQTLADLLGRSEDDTEVAAAHIALLAHPQVQGLIAQAATWPGRPIGRHNDASHPIYALSTLADFGLTAADPGLDRAAAAVLAHQSADGALQSVLNVAPAFGGTGEDTWSWALCDAPTLLYAMLALGMGQEAGVQAAVTHLVNAADEVGWCCRCGPELGRFRGPGRKADPCPIANVYALKALSLVLELLDSPATRQGVEMLLGHWERRAEVKQADAQGRYTAGSMYQAWKRWPFADKKQPSPWLTFLALRIQQRLS